MKHIVNFSGGLCSWMTARRVVEQHGTEDLTLLFADTMIEDPDLHRFLEDCERDIGIKITRIADGRTPWEIFKDVRFLGNSRIDPCSKILKRKLLDSWHRANCQPEDTVVYVGLNWDEGHRFVRFQKAMLPWTVKAPLMEPPYFSKQSLMEAATSRGIEPPKLNREGFPHNNCGGFCIKAGQSQFKLLLEKRPETYAFHEQKEQEFIHFIGKKVSVMRDRTGGKSKPLTMKEFRERVLAGRKTPEFDWGGCGCAIS